MYEHSGIRIKIGSFYGLLPQGHAEFDSGQIGFIYVDEETMKKEKLTKKKAGEILRKEVEIYDDYVSGDVLGFGVDKKNINKGVLLNNYEFSYKNGYKKEKY